MVKQLVLVVVDPRFVSHHSAQTSRPTTRDQPYFVLPYMVWSVCCYLGFLYTTVSGGNTLHYTYCTDTHCTGVMQSQILRRNISRQKYSTSFYSAENHMLYVYSSPSLSLFVKYVVQLAPVRLLERLCIPNYGTDQFTERRTNIASLNKKLLPQVY